MPSSKNFWNKRAHKYDRKLYKGPNFAARLERAAEAFGENANVLDVGCATGEITLDNAKHAKQILGIDHAPRMTDVANAKARDRGIDNARFEPINASDPSLEAQSFDAITVYSVFHLVDDVPSILARLHTLLKPGGHLITETPVLGDWHILWRILIKAMVLLRFAPKITALKLADLEAMFNTAGFDILESKVHNPKSGMHCITARKR